MMRHPSLAAVGALLAVLAVAVAAPAGSPKPAAEAKPAAAAPEVTLEGVMMWEISCVPVPSKERHGDTVVLFVAKGTPEVAAALDEIMKEHFPGDSINGDQARSIVKAFEKRLKYYLRPGKLATDAGKKCRWRNPQMAVTGVVSETGGRKWITPSKIAPTKFTYPAKMMAPDKPLAMPGKDPLVLKVGDKLSLKCILLPAGKFLAGCPFYYYARYQDDYPAMLTISKPYYLSEIPVTQEMYEAVMGSNPSTQKGPNLPVHCAACTDIKKFCRALSDKNGRKVRLPTQAEWEYAARVGTSNPPFSQKYKDQHSAGPKKTFLPIKSRKPNAWGLYDMLGNKWEITSDKRQFSRKDGVDPHYPTDAYEAAGRKHSHNGMGLIDGTFNGWSLTTREGVGNGTGTGYGTCKFRVVVEATPEEIARMRKAEEK